MWNILCEIYYVNAWKFRMQNLFKGTHRHNGPHALQSQWSHSVAQTHKLSDALRLAPTAGKSLNKSRDERTCQQLFSLKSPVKVDERWIDELSIHFFVYFYNQSINLFIYLSINQTNQSINLFINQSIKQSISRLQNSYIILNIAVKFSKYCI